MTAPSGWRAAPRFVVRALTIGLLCLHAWLVYWVRRLVAGRTTQAKREAIRGRVLAELFERLGATFVKFGQIMSTRPDLFGPGTIAELARLQDAVPALPFPVIERVLESELSEKARARVVRIEPTPIAAASVAQVHAGTLDTGEKVALKVQRPKAERQIEQDFSILAFGARLLDKIPSIRLLSLPDATERFGNALRAQLDFRVEAENNRRFGKNFEDVPGVSVPKLYPDLCTRRVLIMEFIEGVKATQPEAVGGDPVKLARGGAECILKMVFIDGFVHADLHPGNIILSSDDRVVLLDFGVVTEIPRDLMRPWIETFLALAQRDGEAAARLFYGYAPSVGKHCDYEAFEKDIVSYFGNLYGKKLSEVEIREVVMGAMAVLRKHRIQVDSRFTVVNVGLLVAEGLGKQLHADIDLVEIALPYLMQAMAQAPTGRPPVRSPPRSAAVPAQ